MTLWTLLQCYSLAAWSRREEISSIALHELNDKHALLGSSLKWLDARSSSHYSVNLMQFAPQTPNSSLTLTFALVRSEAELPLAREEQPNCSLKWTQNALVVVDIAFKRRRRLRRIQSSLSIEGVFVLSPLLFRSAAETKRAYYKYIFAQPNNSSKR